MKEVELLLRCPQYLETELHNVGSLCWVAVPYEHSQRLERNVTF